MDLRIVFLWITLAAGISARNLGKIHHNHEKSLRNGISELDACTDPPGIFLPVPDKCADFCLCADGILIYFTCGGNTYFDAELGFCVEDRNNVCLPRRPCSSVSNGNVIPIEGECYKYQLCIDGDSIPLECKYGMLFSTELGFCVKDVDGVCWDYSTTTTEEPQETTTTEEPVETTTPEESSTTTEEPAETTTTEEPIETTTTEEPIETTTTEEPVETTTTEEPAETTTTEEPIETTTTGEPIETTTTEEPVETTTTDEPVETTTTEEPIETTTTEEPAETTTTEEPIETTTTEEPIETTTTEEPIVTTTTEDPSETKVCEGISFGFVPHQDCNKFYTCMDGEATVITCNDGNYFDKATNRCEVDTDGVCLGRCSVAASGTRFPSEDDCHSYSECQSGEEYSLDCPTGYYFDGTTSQCIEDTDDSCGSTSPSACNGQTDGTIIPHGACGTYFICKNNQAEVESCDNGYRFDVQDLKCVSDPQFTCFCELNTDAVFPSDNCHEYYKCEQGKASTQNCPQGEYFEIMSLGCVADQNEQCLNSATSTTPN